MKKIPVLLLSALLLTACGNDTQTEEVAQSTEESDILDELRPQNMEEYEQREYVYVDFRELLRNPDDYTFLDIATRGRVIQRIEEDDTYTQYLVKPLNVHGDEYDPYTLAFIETERLDGNMLEGDFVSLTGSFLGEYEYTTAGGSQNIVPYMYIHTYGIN